MSLWKRITLFAMVVLVLAGFIAGGIYLMIALGDAMPAIVEHFM
jgi:hypothetical protein